MTTNKSNTLTSESPKNHPSLRERVLQTETVTGRIVESGEMVRLQSRKWYYRFLYADRENKQVTCWGPVKRDGKPTSRGQFVSVRDWEVC